MGRVADWREHGIQPSADEDTPAAAVRPTVLLAKAKAATTQFLRAQAKLITLTLRSAWRARTLLVLTTGIVCIAVGAALVFVPAGLIALGALLLVIAWPEKLPERKQ